MTYPTKVKTLSGDALRGVGEPAHSVSRPVCWLEELQALAARFSGYGIGPDVAGLTLADSRGLLIFLRRVAVTSESSRSPDRNGIDAVAMQKVGPSHG
jgi:hypothetical protein